MKLPIIVAKVANHCTYPLPYINVMKLKNDSNEENAFSNIGIITKLKHFKRTIQGIAKLQLLHIYSVTASTIYIVPHGDLNSDEPNFHSIFAEIFTINYFRGKVSSFSKCGPPDVDLKSRDCKDFKLKELNSGSVFFGWWHYTYILEEAREEVAFFIPSALRAHTYTIIHISIKGISRRPAGYLGSCHSLIATQRLICASLCDFLFIAIHFSR